MLAQRKLPDFATAAWYADPTDHRCPHDAWLESLEITEPAEGARKEKRQTAITARLLGAYHDGAIILRYLGVRKFTTTCETAERGLGDWLNDTFEIAGDAIVHRVTWANGSWMIAAEDISYEWLPKKPNQKPSP